MATISSRRPQSPVRPGRNPSPLVIQSPSVTPSSSVRQSLDLPTSGRSESPASANPAQRRNRAALRDYYNLRNKPVPPNFSRTASAVSATSESTVESSVPTLTELPDSALPAELDSPSFDPELYVSTLLQTSNLRTILRTESTLISEVRNLDGERKALVYDNYSKLITATQTIGNMQRSMNDSEADGASLKDLEKLKPKIEEIGYMATDLGKATEPKRAQADDRRAATEAKQKKETVAWVLGAPMRLEAMLHAGKTEDMHGQWTILSSIFEKWEGVKGVEQVKELCEEVMSRAGETENAD